MGEPPRINSAQWGLAGLIVALAAGALLYRIFVFHNLEQTAALFIGLPAFLAVCLALAPRAKSPLGMVMKGITLALLMSGPVLQEGFICILMAAPLFYLVGLVVGLIANNARKYSGKAGTGRGCMAVLPLFFMGLEGTHEKLSFPREESVTAVKTVASGARDVEEALSSGMRLDRPLPLYLHMGFPRPVRVWGSGLEPGDRRGVRFAGGEGAPGDLILEVAERAPGRVRFRVLSDTSHIAHWLAWREAEVRWVEVAPGRTRVDWTLRYRRLLDPAWYFGPWERYATGLAAEVLIDTVATP